jgi:hypothetical protein
VGVLHHVSLDPADPTAWKVLLDALADGDVVVLLDQAIRAADAVARIIDAAAVAARWCVPAIECAPGTALPAPLVQIADEEWWLLIAAGEGPIEWN